MNRVRNNEKIREVKWKRRPEDTSATDDDASEGVKFGVKATRQ